MLHLMKYSIHCTISSPSRATSNKKEHKVFIHNKQVINVRITMSDNTILIAKSSRPGNMY